MRCLASFLQTFCSHLYLSIVFVFATIRAISQFVAHLGSVRVECFTIHPISSRACHRSAAAHSGSRCDVSERYRSTCRGDTSRSRCCEHLFDSRCKPFNAVLVDSSWIEFECCIPHSTPTFLPAPPLLLSPFRQVIYIVLLSVCYFFLLLVAASTIL